MEKLPTNTERRTAMSDVTLARNLIREIAGHSWNGRGGMLARVHEACTRHGKRFTARRLRGFWHHEAAGVRFHEMIELAEVAAAEKAERERIEKAKGEHADFIGRANNILDRLAVQDEEFHGEYLAALRALAGGSTGKAVAGNAGAIGAHPDDGGKGSGRATSGGVK